MPSTAVVIIVSVLGAAVGIAFTEWLLKRPTFLRPNYAGVPIPCGYGVAAATAQYLALLAAVFVAPGPGPFPILSLGLIGMAMLGLLDDLYGAPQPRGLTGHFKAFLAEGRFTTGMAKLLFGLALCLMVALVLRSQQTHLPFVGLLDGLLLATCANFLNLLDRRPGRAQKVFAALLILALLFLGWKSTLPLWPAILALLYYLPADFRGEKMLGDVGSNALGFTAGLLLLGYPWPWRWIALVTLLCLTLLSERYSFTEIISRNRFLRWLDGLGTA